VEVEGDNEHGPNRPSGVWRRLSSGFGSFTFGALGDVVLTALACALLAGTVLGAVWGWRHHPTLTVSAGALLVAFLCYGAWSLRPGRVGRRGRLAVVAVATLVVIGVWLSYALPYCGCL
jgi:hypothetical protein